MKKVLIVAGLATLALSVNAQSFTEGFDPTGLVGTVNGNSPTGDDIVLPSGTWHARNVSTTIGLTGWFSNNTIWDPQSGAGTAHLCANFNNSTGTDDINNFFMSPVRTLKNGDQIKFWTRTVANPAVWPDRLFLKISTSGASKNPTDFGAPIVSVNNLLTLTDYPAVYTQYTATLSGLPGAGASGRFAFNYNVPMGGPLGVNSNFISIDTVEYIAAPSSTVLNPSSYVVVEGTPFGGNVASLAASDDNKVFILSEESVPNAKIDFFATGAPSAAGTIKVETSATRNDLSEFLYVRNYNTNTWTQVNFQASSLSDVIVTKPTTTANVGAGGAVSAEIVWIPQSDLEAGDGWSEQIDHVVWTIG